MLSRWVMYYCTHVIHYKSVCRDNSQLLWYILLVHINIVIIFIQKGDTPAILAAKKGHKDVILMLTQRGANLDLVNSVSVHEHILDYKTWATIWDFLQY